MPSTQERVETERTEVMLKNEKELVSNERERERKK